MACTGWATALTEDPNNVTGTFARLNGQVISDKDGDVEYWVQYGPSTAYGSETAHQTAEATQANQLARSW